MPSEPIPLSVLTSFLGSGKTKLLSRVLALPDLRDTAVIVSEFGAVALDHLLLEASTDDVVGLPNGCTCCVRLDRVVTKVDTVAGPATLDRYPEAFAQAADLLLLTKADLAAIPEGLVQRLATLNPTAPIVDGVKPISTIYSTAVHPRRYRGRVLASRPRMRMASVHCRCGCASR